MGVLKRLIDSDHALRVWAVASLIANMVIVVTGALVRLTSSGLGCPTWPQCDQGSYVPVEASGVHGLIEFGNRLLTFVLIALAIGLFLAARAGVRSGRQPRKLVPLTVAIGLGIIAQAVIGGLSVLAQLNPWVVGLHMVASTALIVVSVEIVHVVFGLTRITTDRVERIIVRALAVIGIVVVVLGVIVTGAGPNSGDGGATRNGLPLDVVAKAHAWSVWAAVVLTAVGLWFSRDSRRLFRLFAGLAAVEVLQAAIGYLQYFNHLPFGLVLAHMAGTTLFVAALSHLALLAWTGPKQVAPRRVSS